MQVSGDTCEPVNAGSTSPGSRQAATTDEYCRAIGRRCSPLPASSTASSRQPNRRPVSFVSSYDGRIDRGRSVRNIFTIGRPVGNRARGRTAAVAGERFPRSGTEGTAGGAAALPELVAAAAGLAADDDGVRRSRRSPTSTRRRRTFSCVRLSVADRTRRHK